MGRKGAVHQALILGSALAILALGCNLGGNKADVPPPETATVDQEEPAPPVADSAPARPCHIPPTPGSPPHR